MTLYTVYVIIYCFLNLNWPNLLLVELVDMKCITNIGDENKDNGDIIG